MIIGTPLYAFPFPISTSEAVISTAAAAPSSSSDAGRSDERKWNFCVASASRAWARRMFSSTLESGSSRLRL